MKKNIIILIIVIALISCVFVSECSATMSQDEMKEFILEQRNHESIFSDEIVRLLHSTESTVEIIELDGQLSGYGEFHIYMNDKIVAGGVIVL